MIIFCLAITALKVLCWPTKIFLRMLIWISFFVLSLLLVEEWEGYDRANDNEKKKNLYIKVQEFARRFEKENSSIVCRELLGLKGRSKPDPEERTKGYYLRRPCPMYASSSASILETFLIEEGILDSNGEKRT